MSPFEGFPNDQPDNSEVIQYKQYLDEKLENIKAHLHAESDQHTLKVFEEMKETLEKGNEDALKMYNDSIERSKALTSERLRSRSMESAKKMYSTIIEGNQKLLDGFLKDFDISLKE